jgi:hypothetical protein
MTAPTASPSTEDVSKTRARQAIRGPEIGPALKRDKLLQRVRAARKRLSPAADTLPRLR